MLLSLQITFSSLFTSTSLFGVIYEHPIKFCTNKVVSIIWLRLAGLRFVVTSWHWLKTNGTTANSSKYVVEVHWDSDLSWWHCGSCFRHQPWGLQVRRWYAAVYTLERHREWTSPVGDSRVLYRLLMWALLLRIAYALLIHWWDSGVCTQRCHDDIIISYLM